MNSRLRDIGVIVSAALLMSGCATVASDSGEKSTAAASEAPAVREATTDAESPRPVRDTKPTESLAEKGAVPAPATDEPRSTWRAEREARAASANATAGSILGGGANSSANSSASVATLRPAPAGDSSRLAEQLTSATKELAALRAANAKLRAEKAPSATVVATAVKPDSSEDKLTGSMKSYSAFKQEVTTLLAEMDRVRQENVALSSNLKAAVVQADEARAALGQLEKDLSAERKARLEAEKSIAQLRDQLRAVARAVSAAGLNVEKISGGAEATSKR